MQTIRSHSRRWSCAVTSLLLYLLLPLYENMNAAARIYQNSCQKFVVIIYDLPHSILQSRHTLVLAVCRHTAGSRSPSAADSATDPYDNTSSRFYYSPTKISACPSRPKRPLLFLGMVSTGLLDSTLRQ